MSQCSRTLKVIFCILDFQIVVKYPLENVVKKTGMPVHHREVCRPYVLFLYMLPRIKDISKKKTQKPAFFHN